MFQDGTGVERQGSPGAPGFERLSVPLLLWVVNNQGVFVFQPYLSYLYNQVI
jgi:hypothetical protein